MSDGVMPDGTYAALYGMPGPVGASLMEPREHSKRVTTHGRLKLGRLGLGPGSRL